MGWWVTGRPCVLLDSRERREHGLLSGIQARDGLDNLVLTRLKRVHAGVLTPIKSQYQADKGASGGQAAHQ